MNDLNRRNFGLSLAAFAFLGEALSSAQTSSPTTPSGKQLPDSKVYKFSDLPTRLNANGSVTRAVCAGYLPTGEFIEVHETALPPGQMPHPAHRHSHSELILVRNGQLEFQLDGTPQTAGLGSVVFFASNRLHGMKNVGTTIADYFVVAIGVQKQEA